MEETGLFTLLFLCKKYKHLFLFFFAWLKVDLIIIIIIILTHIPTKVRKNILERSSGWSLAQKRKPKI